MKITDKMRLDWLQKNMMSLTYCGMDGWCVNGGMRYKTARQAIDSAIRKGRNE